MYVCIYMCVCGVCAWVFVCLCLYVCVCVFLCPDVSLYIYVWPSLCSHLLLGPFVKVVLDVLVSHGEAEAAVVAGSSRHADAPPDGKVKKWLFSSLTTRPNKLEGLSLETVSSQVLESKCKARANPIGVPFRCFLLGQAPGVTSKC